MKMIVPWIMINNRSTQSKKSKLSKIIFLLHHQYKLTLNRHWDYIVCICIFTLFCIKKVVYFVIHVIYLVPYSFQKHFQNIHHNSHIHENSSHSSIPQHFGLALHHLPPCTSYIPDHLSLPHTIL